MRCERSATQEEARRKRWCATGAMVRGDGREGEEESKKRKNEILGLLGRSWMGTVSGSG